MTYRRTATTVVVGALAIAILFTGLLATVCAQDPESRSDTLARLDREIQELELLIERLQAGGASRDLISRQLLIIEELRKETLALQAPEDDPPVPEDRSGRDETASALRTPEPAPNDNGDTPAVPDGGTPDSGGDERATERRGGEKTIYRYAIISSAWSPDGKQLVTGSGTGRIHVWDVARSQLVRTVDAHSNWVFSLAFTPDGKTLVSGGGDDRVVVWNVETWQPVRVLAGHTDDVHGVAVFPDGKRLASTGDDRTVRIWSLQTGEQLRVMTGHTKQCPCIAVSPDGKTIATGSRDHTIRLWDADSGDLRRTLELHSKDVLSVAFSPDGRQLASASYDRKVIVTEFDDDFATKRSLLLSGHTDWAFCVRYRPDGVVLASGAGDGRVRLWKADEGTAIHAIAIVASGDVASVVWSPDGRRLAATTSNGLVRIVDHETRETLARLRSPDVPVPGEGE